LRWRLPAVALQCEAVESPLRWPTPALAARAFMALLVVATVRLGITVLGFVRLRRLIASLLRARSSPTAEASSQIGWAVPRVARFVPRATCLTQALAAQLLFARAGYAASLRIGVARQGEAFQAHAWLEDGTVVVFGDRSGFVPLPPVEPILG
jgi:hypothetical protein